MRHTILPGGAVVFVVILMGLVPAHAVHAAMAADWSLGKVARDAATSGGAGSAWALPMGSAMSPARRTPANMRTFLV